MKSLRPTILILLAAFLSASSAWADPGPGLPVQLISDTPADGAFAIAANGWNSPLWLDAKDHAGVLRAATDLIDVFADPSKRGDLSSPAIKDWANWVRDNARTLKSTPQIADHGIHTLKVWMVESGMVLASLIVHYGNLPASYFGPQ